jgi:hypothetical protein
MSGLLRTLASEPGWVWLIIAAFLVIIDILAPGFYMVWFAGAAVVVGVILFWAPMDTEWQILAFCAASVLALLLSGALWSGQRRGASDKPLLNLRAQQMVGRTFVLATAIHGGQGRITAGDGLWMVRGPDLPAGAVVRVKDADGTVLIVEAA